MRLCIVDDILYKNALHTICGVLAGSLDLHGPANPRCIYYCLSMEHPVQVVMDGREECVSSTLRRKIKMFRHLI